MSAFAAIDPVFLEMIVTRLLPWFLTVAGNNTEAARTTALGLLADYNPETEDELTLAAEVAVFSLNGIDAAARSMAPDLTFSAMLRLHRSAIAHSRAAHKGRLALAKLRKERLAAKATPEPKRRLADTPAPVAAGSHATIPASAPAPAAAPSYVPNAAPANGTAQFPPSMTSTTPTRPPLAHPPTTAAASRPSPVVTRQQRRAMERATEKARRQQAEQTRRETLRAMRSGASQTAPAAPVAASTNPI